MKPTIPPDLQQLWEESCNPEQQEQLLQAMQELSVQAEVPHALKRSLASSDLIEMRSTYFDTLWRPAALAACVLLTVGVSQWWQTAHRSPSQQMAASAEELSLDDLRFQYEIFDEEFILLEDIL